MKLWMGGQLGMCMMFLILYKSGELERPDKGNWSSRTLQPHKAYYPTTFWVFSITLTHLLFILRCKILQLLLLKNTHHSQTQELVLLLQHSVFSKLV